MNNENLPCVFPLRSAEDYERVEARVMRSLRRYAEFEAERSKWYREGAGRPVSQGGLGHAFYYNCIHGASAYTDYDNICGPCEDGWGYWDYARELDDAARALRYAHQTVERRVEAALPLLSESWGQLSHNTVSEINAWISAPVKNFH